MGQEPADVKMTTVVTGGTLQLETDEATTGDNVRLALSGISKQDVLRGQILAEPGLFQKVVTFQANFYIPSSKRDGTIMLPEEGAELLFQFTSSAPGKHFGIPGVLRGVTQLSEHVVHAHVDLDSPVAMKEAMRFSLGKNGPSSNMVGGHGIALELDPIMD
mmetsp:Transcript_38593/g.80178  ORF Transcript_38593/g.80178 Transcript_38593/m.80178 type:complete len:161 (-) Transcript_38593:93-575(-)